MTETLEQVGPRLPALARAAIVAALQGRALDPTGAGPAAPAFVTLRRADGTLRGCIGSLATGEPSLTREVARVAVLAATQDPRFPPLSADELPGTSIEVSVLLPEQPIRGVEQLDPARFGVIVRDDAGRRGVLLPEVPGIDSPHQQLQVARHKAGIDEHAPVQLSRFAVRKFR